jgi:hypothetical protein
LAIIQNYCIAGSRVEVLQRKIAPIHTVK